MTTLSMPREKIRFVLLEGIHSAAADTLRRAGYTNLTTHDQSLTGDALIEAIGEAHFVGIRSRTQLTEAVLEQTRRLVAVGCFCIGTNQVDLEAAELRGIPVFNAPFSNTRSVAELVLAQAVFLMRGIPEKNAAAHRGEWLKSAVGAYEVRGKTLGIVGYGHIGSQLGVLAESLGMRVVYYDIANKLPLGNASVTDDLNAMLAASDVVSLHVPETPQTQRMIGATELAAMKTGAYLINASRGTVVDIDALVEALESGHVAGAAVDVFPTEPKSNADEFASPLRRFDNDILTPHIGGSTQEAQENIALDVAAKMARYSDNGSTASAVNFPEVSLPDHPNKRRILHVHKNVPGVLERINKVFSEEGVNIAAQYLQTTPRVGYVVMEVDIDDARQLTDRLNAVPGTIRTRLLF